jgi:hypothetical protein
MITSPLLYHLDTIQLLDEDELGQAMGHRMRTQRDAIIDEISQLRLIYSIRSTDDEDGISVYVFCV